MSDAIRRYRQGEAALVVNRAWCKGCDLCVDACPVEILALDDLNRIVVTDISQCIFCGICAVRCPDFVFVLERPRKEALVAVAAGGEGSACD
jgi:2-oxoglutarate ferredoxin oxidoreductase subunit delta